MAIPSLFNTYIDETYQRLVQTTGSGAEFADGLGNPITFGQTPTGSLLTTASAAGNTITFTKGDGSTFPVTVTGGGTPGDGDQAIQFNSASVFSGSAKLKYDYVNSNIILTGSLLVTQSYISTVDYIDFTKLVTSPAHNEGRLHWFDDTKTLQIDTDKNDFMIEIGHQNVVRVYNDTGADIPLGKVVRISGSQGNQPTIVTASWEDDSSSAATLGFAATLIAGSGGNSHGYVITNGVLRNVNTNGFTVGTQLYLSSSGNFTSTPPDAPLHEVRLGKVVVSNSATGVIYVDIMNGYELTELHDVKTNGVTPGDLLIRSGSLWINSKILTGSYTLSGSLTTNDGVSVQTLTASIVSASQITGSLFGTASWASNAITASYVTGSIFTNANSAASASYSVTSSYTVSASFATTASRAISASYAPTLPGGSNTQIQYNNSNTLAGDSAFTYNYTQQSLQQGNNVVTSGSYSHAEGVGTIAYGVGSHAEGSGSWTGQLGYLTSNITYNDGFNETAITLDSSYGDIVALLNSATRVIFDDSDYDNIFGRQILTNPSNATFSSPNTILYFTGDYTTTTAVIGLWPEKAPAGANTPIRGNYAHSEGKDTAAAGIGSHAAGTGSFAQSNYSYAGGEGTVAYAQGQTVVGQYNTIGNIGNINSFVIGKGTDTSTRSDIVRIIPGGDQFYISASTVQFAGLPDTAQTNVLTYDPANGQVYYTASSAIGGLSYQQVQRLIAIGI